VAFEGWDRLYWDISLENPPEVVSISTNIHGIKPIDRYRLPELWSLHVYGYLGRLIVDGNDLPIRPGYVSIAPPMTIMEYHYVGISTHIYVHLRLPPPGNGPLRRIRAMQDLGTGYNALYNQLAEVIPHSRSEPARVNARVWDVLWQLSSRTEDDERESAIHPAAKRAAEIIERNLVKALTVSDLAQDVGVSYSYLARLFHDAYGESVVGFIRKRRIERAVHLIERTTLPIKTIAASVGMPDLQYFNKTMRSELGASPREIRRRYMGQ